MSDRIRQLEEALRHECSLQPGEIHPLLKDDLLAIASRHNSERSNIQQTNINDDADFSDDENDLTDSMGLMTLSGGHSSHLIGASGTEHALLIVGIIIRVSDVFFLRVSQEAGFSGAYLADDGKPPLLLPDKIIQASQLWPFSALQLPSDLENMCSLLEDHLPTLERASGLVEACLQNVSWFMQLVTREQVLEELMPAVYRNPKARLTLHKLALLFMVFAVGAAADFTQNPLNQEGEYYHHLARAAIGVKSIFEEHSFSAVQVMALLGCYEVVSGRNHSPDYGWKLMHLAMGLCSSMVLYREPPRMIEDPKMTQRRRLLFWELYFVDGWQSLCMGRPAMFRREWINCKFPLDPNETEDDINPQAPTLWNLKFRFAKEVLAFVTDVLCSGRPYKYSDILNLDRLVRNFDKTHLENSTTALDPLDPQPFAHESLLHVLRELALLYIHRSFFVRALTDRSKNPLRSPFAQSFLTAYKSATAVLQGLRDRFSKAPEIFFRHWSMWAYMLCAAVIVASVVTKNPDMRLAPAAVRELQLTIEVFEMAMEQPLVREVWPILVRMYGKAKVALDEAREGKFTGEVTTEEQKDDDSSRMLDILKGKTRTLKGPPNRLRSTIETCNQDENSEHTLASASTVVVAASEQGQLQVKASGAQGLYYDSKFSEKYLTQETSEELLLESHGDWGHGNWQHPLNEIHEHGHETYMFSDSDTLQNITPENLSTATLNSFGLLPYTENSNFSSGLLEEHAQSEVPYTAAPLNPAHLQSWNGNAEPIPFFQGAEQAGELWQSFVSQSGFATENEMMRVWGISQS